MKTTAKIVAACQDIDSPAVASYLNQPSAGFPAPGDDVVEEALNLQNLLVKNPTATFFVRVNGDSMEDAKIFDGDVLVVDRSRQYRSGSIVVAAVNGELVVKKLKQTTSGWYLESANDAYPSIILNHTDECHVWGVVIGSAREFA